MIGLLEGLLPQPRGYRERGEGENVEVWINSSGYNSGWNACREEVLRRIEAAPKTRPGEPLRLSSWRRALLWLSKAGINKESP